MSALPEKEERLPLMGGRRSRRGEGLRRRLFTLRETHASEQPRCNRSEPVPVPVTDSGAASAPAPDTVAVSGTAPVTVSVSDSVGVGGAESVTEKRTPDLSGGKARRQALMPSEAFQDARMVQSDQG